LCRKGWIERGRGNKKGIRTGSGGVPVGGSEKPSRKYRGAKGAFLYLEILKKKEEVCRRQKGPRENEIGKKEQNKV